MSLLRPEDYLQIREAVKSVTDTFMVSPVVYHLSQGDSTDRWQEDKITEKFSNYLLSALVEYDTADTDEVKMHKEGAKDYDHVTITVNVEDIEPLGLVNSENDLIFTREADYFTLKGKVYRLTDAYLDGALEDKQVLSVIKGKLSDTRKTANSLTIVDAEGVVSSGSIEQLITGLQNRITQLESDTVASNLQLIDTLTTISQDTWSTEDF